MPFNPYIIALFSTEGVKISLLLFISGGNTFIPALFDFPIAILILP